MSTEPASGPARPTDHRDALILLLGIASSLLTFCGVGGFTEQWNDTVVGWFLKVAFFVGLGLLLVAIGLDLSRPKREGVIEERVREAIAESSAVPHVGDESDRATGSQYPPSAVTGLPPVVSPGNDAPAEPAGSSAPDGESSRTRLETSTSEEQLIEQINAIVKEELRLLERRGLRTQWFFFLAGIPVGILINMWF